MKKFRFRDTGKLLKTTFKSWNDKDPFRLSAIIAYYAIFSLPALLVIIISVAGLIFGREAVTGQISGQISSMIGADTGKQIEEMIAAASEKQVSIWATIIGVVTLIIGATGVFVELQKSLNIIWEVKADPKKSGIMVLLKARLFSFGLILSIGFLLLISLVLSSVLTAISGWLESHFPDAIAYLIYVLNFVLSLGVITLLFALMFKYLPDAKIKWRQVWLGASFTSILFVIGKSLLGLYFGTAEPGSTYGAAGSVILILLWVSYSSMIVFFGAEFTRSYSDMYSGEVVPSQHSVKAEGRGQTGDE